MGLMGDNPSPKPLSCGQFANRKFVDNNSLIGDARAPVIAPGAPQLGEPPCSQAEESHHEDGFALFQPEILGVVVDCCRCVRHCVRAGCARSGRRRAGGSAALRVQRAFIQRGRLLAVREDCLSPVSGLRVAADSADESGLLRQAQQPIVRLLSLPKHHLSADCVSQRIQRIQRIRRSRLQRDKPSQRIQRTVSGLRAAADSADESGLLRQAQQPDNRLLSLPKHHLSADCVPQRIQRTVSGLRSAADSADESGLPVTCHPVTCQRISLALCMCSTTSSYNPWLIARAGACSSTCVNSHV
jgi:hypothetical protein